MLQVDLFCWATLLFIAWFAVHFAAERILSDASYFLLQMVDRETFYVNQGRWIMPLSQWSAVLGLKAGVPLTMVITLYSLGSVVVATLAYLFVRFGLKDHLAGLTVVATQLIGVGHAVFCPVFEFYYAAPLLVCCLALLKAGHILALPREALFATLLFIVLSSHFLAMIVTAMVMLLFGIHRHKRLTWIAALVTVLHTIIRTAVLSDYEQRAITSLWIRFDHLGWTWVFHPGRIIGHLEHAVSVYPDVMFLSVLFVMALVRARCWSTSAAFIGGLFVLYVLQSFYFPDGTHSVYREFVDYPFFIWVVVVPYALWPTAIGRERWSWVVGMMFIGRCLLWLILSGTYVDRVEWMRDRIAAAHTQGIRRGVITDTPSFITPCWGSVVVAPLNPMEVMLFSAEAGPSATVVLVPVENEPPDMRSFGTELENRLITERIPLIWHSSSPYFALPATPFKILK